MFNHLWNACSGSSSGGNSSSSSSSCSSSSNNNNNNDSEYCYCTYYSCYYTLHIPAILVVIIGSLCDIASDSTSGVTSFKEVNNKTSDIA